MIQPRITYNDDYMSAGAYDRFYRPGLTDALGATAEETLVHNPTNAGLRLLAPETGGALLPPEQANEQYSIGNLRFDEPVSENRARELRDMKLAEMKRQEILARGPQGVGVEIAKFGTALLASVADPINIFSAFLPSLAVRNMAQAAKVTAPAWSVGRGGTIGQHVAGGAIEGVAGAAMIEPLPYLAAQRDQLDYDAFDSFMNVAFGGIIGGGAHGLSRALELRGERRTARAIDNLPEAQRYELQQAAVAQTIDDQVIRNHGAAISAQMNKDRLGSMGELWADDVIRTAPQARPFELGPLTGSRHMNYTAVSEQDMRWIDAANKDLQDARGGHRVMLETEGQGSTPDVMGVKTDSPDWFQQYNKQPGSTMTKEKAQAVIDKMRTGAPLGKEEGRVAEALWGAGRDMRERNAQQIVDFRDARAAANRAEVEAEIDAIADREAEFWEYDDAEGYRNDIFADLDALDEVDAFIPTKGDDIDLLEKETAELLDSLKRDLEATDNAGMYDDILENADLEVKQAEVTANGWRALGACMARRG